MRLDQNLILVPVLAQVLLTLVVMVLMGRAKARSMRTRRQRMDDIALATAADWDDDARKLVNNYANQFEMPVLFYVVSAFALITRSVDVAMVLLGLAFVASRVVARLHPHRQHNACSPRFTVFLVGRRLLAAMWGLVGWRVIAAGLV